MQRFTSFVTSVEQNFETYTDEVWKQKDLQFEKFAETEYARFRSKLTGADQKQIGKLKAKYVAAKTKSKIKSWTDKAAEGLNQLEGIIEGITESFVN